MCGRYSNAKELKKLARRAKVVEPIGLFPKRYNIAPTQSAPVIFMDRTGPVMKMMRWGISFGGRTSGPVLNNARAETIETKPAFKQAFQERRCLVPADSFYEWQERAGKRQPFRIVLQDEEPFCFAGIWEPEVMGEQNITSDIFSRSFTIITMAANEAMKPLHHRMPVIVDPEQYLTWLEDGGFKSVLASPFQSPLKIYPVSALVNTPANDDPRCFEPVQIERDFFEKQWWSES